MKYLSLITLLVTGLMCNGQHYTDHWVAVDGEGRILPTHKEAGDLRTDKIVGVFYYIWLGGHPSQMTGIHDITKILKTNPDNPAWGAKGQYHHWGEPEYGYFRSEDPYVIRHDLQMLANAKVDFIYFDVTNSFTYLNTVRAICDISLAMRQEGVKTPDIAFLTNASTGRVMTELYNDFYSDNTYNDLWFYWEGKPLIFGKKDDPNLSAAAKNFFTIKYSWAWTNATAEADHWQWHDLPPQDYAWSTDKNIADQIPVSTASHPTINIGKSYNNGSQPAVNSDYVTQFTDQGLFFQEQWDRAISVDPKVVMVTQWNEWIAMRSIQSEKGTFAGRPISKGGSTFVDVFSQEFNRDMAPMKGGYSDNYYYQLVSNIRKFKGMAAPQAQIQNKTISINGDFSDWNSLGPEFIDPPGDVVHRNFVNYDNSAVITNNWGRNDILLSKASYDASNIYFYVQTDKNITSHTNARWMYLLIDIDKNRNTGWEGYDYIVNYQVNSSTVTTIRTWNKSAWQQVAEINYSVNGNKLELSIPRNLIGMEGASPNFYFKWADNPDNLTDISSFFLKGDIAPDRRFTYYFNGAD